MPTRFLTRFSVRTVCVLTISLLSGTRIAVPASASMVATSTPVMSAVAAISPEALFAECQQCYEPLGSGEHKFFANSECIFFGGSCYDCDRFNSCHYNLQTGRCGEWHDPCGMGGDEVARIESILDRSDTAELASLLAEKPDYVRIHHGRELVQVMNCRGSVILQYTLPADVLAALD